MGLNVSNLIRRPTDETGFSPVYQAQQRSWNERYSIHEQNAVWWRYTAFGCIGVALMAVGGIAWIGAQEKDRPYIVERNQLGDEVAVRVAEETTTADPRVIQAEISRWLFDVRTVSVDATTERHFIYEAYDLTDRSSAANGELNDWFSKNNPFKRAADEIVTVNVLSTLPLEPRIWKTWRVDWREETRTRTGDLISSKIHELTVTIALKQPTSEAAIRKNPAGVFVQNFSWTERGS